MIRDSASMAVMIENIGSRNRRWLDRKRHDFLMSSSCCLEKQILLRTRAKDGTISYNNTAGGYQISSSDSSTVIGGSSSSDEGSSKEVRQQLLRDQHHGAASNELHDYNAPSLFDPIPGQDMSITSGSSGDEGKGNDYTDPNNDANRTKKRKLRTDTKLSSKVLLATGTAPPRSVVPTRSQPPRLNSLPSNIARSGGIAHNVKVMVPLPVTITAGSTTTTTSVTTMSKSTSTLPPSNGKTNLIRAPAVSLPPFVGIGKKKPPSTTMKCNTISGALSSSALKLASINTSQQPPVDVRDTVSATNHHSSNEDTTSSSNHNNANNDNTSPPSSKANIITIDNDTSSNYSSPHQSSLSPPQNNHPRHLDIQANYHINEDDMILTDNVLMCPFVFKSQEAVYCGAQSECIQHGMIRATFSSTNKLCNVEMIFDAMGYCQQLERASGNDGGMMAQIIPNSLEMALAPNSEEGRVITLAEAPFNIVSVNEVWTSITGYTQVDAEGKDLISLLLHGSSGNNNNNDSCRKQQQDFENVTRGICCASTNIHTDKSGRQFLNFMCSYPLSNLSNEVTHILHVCKEL